MLNGHQEKTVAREETTEAVTDGMTEVATAEISGVVTVATTAGMTEVATAGIIISAHAAITINLENNLYSICAEKGYIKHRKPFKT
jgi:hypothetical protein